VVASSAKTSFTATIFQHTRTQPPQNQKKLRCHHFGFTTAGEEWEEKKYVLTRPKKEEVCGGNGRIGGQVNVSYQSKSDRFNDTGKPSLTAEFNPTNPLEQGLGDGFFCPF
jgi:hypothetical protein